MWQGRLAPSHTHNAIVSYCINIRRSFAPAPPLVARVPGHVGIGLHTLKAAAIHGEAEGGSPHRGFSGTQSRDAADHIIPALEATLRPLRNDLLRNDSVQSLQVFELRFGRAVD